MSRLDFLPNLLSIYIDIAEFCTNLYIFYRDKVDSLAVIIVDSKLVLGVKADLVYKLSLLFLVF